MRRALIITGLISLFVLTGCDISKTEVVQYNRMEKAYKLMNTEIDKEKYNSVLEFLGSLQLSNKQYINEFRKTDTLLSDNIYDNLLNNASEELEIENEEYRREYEEEQKNNPYNEDNLEYLKNSEGQYPIYDTHYTILGYGTLEEAQKNIRYFNSLPEVNVKTIESFGDTLIAYVDNKYTGVKAIKLKIIGNKIDEYDILDIKG